MTQKSSSGKSTATAREDRLKAALKANLARRKRQAKARSDESKDTNTTPSSEGS
ncbi:MAG TPA: hypothetical protein VJ906_02095 [Roseovarius sp.]|uniref:hypothetical protein n=1 Tax=Marivita sp. TaxID=2003365 RepID=UPI0025BA9593|nr:hypothetical protein [Marivita sp.]HKL45016.1 hypothetical protein [Roseovarius sp.]